MSRHLQSCKARAQQDGQVSAATGKLESIYHAKVVSYSPFWLHIEMSSSRKLSDLDHFLKAIWLECCGHMSEFEIGEKRYSVFEGYDSMWEEKPNSMNVALNKVLGLKDRFNYDYDFGSTTSLSGQVIGERMGVLKDKVKILARNQSPEIPCSHCNNAAANFCPYCEESFCQECSEAEEHEEKCGVEADELLPVVNSPRLGGCAYMGDSDPDTFGLADSV